MCLGEAVRLSRLLVKENGKQIRKDGKNKDDSIFTWPAFVLYGPPTLQISKGDILI